MSHDTLLPSTVYKQIRKIPKPDFKEHFKCTMTLKTKQGKTFSIVLTVVRTFSECLLLSPHRTSRCVLSSNPMMKCDSTGTQPICLLLLHTHLLKVQADSMRPPDSFLLEPEYTHTHINSKCNRYRYAHIY